MAWGKGCSELLERAVLHVHGCATSITTRKAYSDIYIVHDVRLASFSGSLCPKGRAAVPQHLHHHHTQLKIDTEVDAEVP